MCMHSIGITLKIFPMKCHNCANIGNIFQCKAREPIKYKENINAIWAFDRQ